MRQPTTGGTAESVPELLDRIEPEIRQVLVRFRVPSQDAEDLIQETLLAFVAKRSSIANPVPWLLATLRNQCLLYWRRRRRRFIDAIDSALLERVAGSDPGDQERRTLARDLSGALEHLPRRCRSILRLRYGLDCGAPEIAETLGYRPDTIRQATLRCLSALSRQLTSPTGFAEEVPSR